jgi:hypothetical protein
MKTIGWREWVELLDFNISYIKAKIDSGARTSSLHALNLEFYIEDQIEYVEFETNPIQGDLKRSVSCKSRVLEYKDVKSSNGQVEKRPVILTKLKLGDQVIETEVTLSNRDEMGFKMLIGRQTLKQHFLIDVDKSFLGNSPPDMTTDSDSE